MNDMTKIFISDLHLEESRPEITDLFINFLKDCTSSADSLYILGDFLKSGLETMIQTLSISTLLNN